MRKLIKHISDWHAMEDIEGLLRREGPFDEDEPDLLLVTGDMVREAPGWHTLRNKPGGHEAMGKWQRAVWEGQALLMRSVFPNAHIVAVPGNHDWCDYAIEGLVQSFDTTSPQTIIVDGIRITGFRGVPWFNGNWSHEIELPAVNRLVQELDPKADIVITHTPPYGALDLVPRFPRFGGPPSNLNVGAVGLREWIGEHPTVQLHAFGHIHECGGQTEMWYNATLSNAACSMNNLVINV